MKRLAVFLMCGAFGIGAFGVAPGYCWAAPACAAVAVDARVEVAQGELTLADLLGPGSCRQLREAAAQVKLGAMPRPGSVRVLDGGGIRRLLKQLAEQDSMLAGIVGAQIPQRVVVRRAGAAISCAQIARLVEDSAGSQNGAVNGAAAGKRESDLDCAGARGVPEGAALEITGSSWNAALQRREFRLRCLHAEDCVPFLVWVHEAPPGSSPEHSYVAAEKPFVPAGGGVGGADLLVKAGQTATLIWEGAGIRVVLPVTCLDAGGRGEFVRVRFKNTARVLRAEVLGDGTLRASL
jgi:hypothetical protein